MKNLFAYVYTFLLSSSTRTIHYGVEMKNLIFNPRVLKFFQEDKTCIYEWWVFNAKEFNELLM